MARDGVAADGVAQAGGAGGGLAGVDEHAGGDLEVLAVFPAVLAGGVGGEFADLGVVRGGVLGGFGDVPDAVDVVVAGVAVLAGVDDEVGVGLVDAVEQFDALQSDGLVVGGGRRAGAAVNAEDAVGRAGLPWHGADLAFGGGGGECVAVEVEGGVGGVHRGLGEDGAGACGAVVAFVVAFRVGADVDGRADVEAVGGAGGDDDAPDVAFSLGDRGLQGVLPAASEHVGVLGGPFDEEHELDVEVVGLASAGVSLAFEQGVVDGAVLGAEFAVDFAA